MTWVTDDSSYFEADLPQVHLRLLLLRIFIYFEDILHVCELIVIGESIKIAHVGLIKGYFFALAHHLFLFPSKIIG